MTGHYQTNPRDLRFVLFEMPGISPNWPHGPFDQATAEQLLAEADRLAREDLAPSYAPTDRVPPVFDPDHHTVTTPQALHDSYQALMDSEIWRLNLPEELGGTPAPRSLWWAIAELAIGANPALWMYASWPTLAGTLHTLGTPEQRHWAQLCVDHRWGATMALTEPEAGSDVGAIRTRAHQQPDGSWHLEGVKSFISCSEHDLADNIIHFVLARPTTGPTAASSGTKGLSLFLVPKYLFHPENGALSQRNGIHATRLEDKMGLRASATCELTLGARQPAKGWLMGETHDGIRQMFHIIEYARMLVGTKALATLSSGYLNALHHAQTRRQGADLTQANNKAAPPVAIIHHPDVRRSLLLQKSYTEGLRALIHFAAHWQDTTRLQRGHWPKTHVQHVLTGLGCNVTRIGDWIASPTRERRAPSHFHALCTATG